MYTLRPRLSLLKKRYNNSYVFISRITFVSEIAVEEENDLFVLIDNKTKFSIDQWHGV